jgi:hypothetical protein
MQGRTIQLAIKIHSREISENETCRN